MLMAQPSTYDMLTAEPSTHDNFFISLIKNQQKNMSYVDGSAIEKYRVDLMLFI